MSDIVRATALWTGFTGGPGWSRFYFIGATTSTLADPAWVATSVHNLFTDLASLLPSDVTVQVQQEQDIIDSATGDQTGIQTGTAVLPVHGSDTGAYSAVSGAVIPWEGDAFINGRKQRGRTFIVPMGASAYQTDGTLSTAALSALAVAGGELTGDTDNHLVLWHRPTSKTGADGLYSIAGLGTIHDRAAVLRSRRG